MKIIVDAMGGDNAPQAIVEGSVNASKKLGIEVLLVGREAEIAPLIPADANGVSVLNAEDVMTMEDDPASIMKAKKESSMAVALRALKDGEGDALVSAGNSGALLVGATMITKRIRGIRRAAFSPLMPTAKGNTLLVDSGANAECTPEYLLQFAIMGSHYMRLFCGIENPRVGLLNNGTEECKGTPLQKEAYQLLKAAPINFVGNVEGRDVAAGTVDVIVTDGFTGNILLKTFEGVGMFFARQVKAMFKKNIFTKLAALVLSGGIKDLKKKMDYNEVGGAPLLGISKPVIKAHGSSGAKAFENAIKQAVSYANQGIIEKITESVKKEDNE